MSDKNPYYSIPKALGEPREEIDMLPTCPDMSAMIELRERIKQMISEAFGGAHQQPRGPVRRYADLTSCQGRAILYMKL